jgi:hypothetical protein
MKCSWDFGIRARKNFELIPKSDKTKYIEGREL